MKLNEWDLSLPIEVISESLMIGPDGSVISRGSDPSEPGFISSR